MMYKMTMDTGNSVTMDARRQILQRKIAEGERLLRNLRRRQDREPAVRDSYYRLKVALTRQKAQLKRL